MKTYIVPKTDILLTEEALMDTFTMSLGGDEGVVTYTPERKTANP
jgi:hypothetical protein